MLRRARSVNRSQLNRLPVWRNLCCGKFVDFEDANTGLKLKRNVGVGEGDRATGTPVSSPQTIVFGWLWLRWVRDLISSVGSATEQNVVRTLRTVTGAVFKHHDARIIDREHHSDPYVWAPLRVSSLPLGKPASRASERATGPAIDQLPGRFEPCRIMVNQNEPGVWRNVGRPIKVVLRSAARDADRVARRQKQSCDDASCSQERRWGERDDRHSSVAACVSA